MALNPFNYTQGIETPPKNYPVNAGVGLLGLANWGASAYTEIIAAVPNDWILVGLILNSATGGSYNWEIDIATGAAASEVVIGTISGYYGNYGDLYFPIPINNIASGARVSAKARKANAFNETLTVTLLYYQEPIAGKITSTAKPMLVTPTGTVGITLTSGAGAWLNGAYATIVAATTGRYILGAVELVGVDDGHGGHVQEAEIDIAVGSAGNEVVVTTIRPNTYNLTPLQPGQYGIKPVLDNIASGVRISARLRSAQAYATLTAIKLHYYLAITEDISKITTSQKQTFLPSAANGTPVISGAGAWINGNWTQFSAALATAIGITQISIGSSAAGIEFEVDLGIGAVGFETVIGTVRWFSGVSSVIKINNSLTFLISILVATGSRLSARARATVGAQTATIAIGYIASPTFYQLTEAVHKDYITASDSVLVASNAVAYTSSAWFQLDASADGNKYITGIISTSQVGGVIFAVDLGVGAAGSEVVIGTLRFVDNAGTMQWFPFQLPIYILNGSRLSVRIRRSAAGSASSRFAATYYDDLNIPNEPNESSGLYTIVPDRTSDEIVTDWNPFTSMEKKKPDPFAILGLIGDN